MEKDIPIVIAGNRHSLTRINYQYLPEKYHTIRINNFYFEDKYYLGANTWNEDTTLNPFATAFDNFPR